LARLSVTFIGAGNVAWHMAPALENIGCYVKYVCSRNPRNARALVNRLYEAEAVQGTDLRPYATDLYLLTVPDDHIEAVAQQLMLPPESTLLHTSGTQPLSVLEFAAAAYKGVFYPLQTFSKEKRIEWGQVPMLVESDDKGTRKMLLQLGKKLSQTVSVVPSAQRSVVHLAAVFACNFSNHMLTVAQDIMQENQLKYEWLKPLIVETIDKALSLAPDQAQTGPARRKDLQTLEKHLQMLGPRQDLTELYQTISQHILDWYE